MGDPRFLGTEQRRRMGAASSHLSMITRHDHAKASQAYDEGKEHKFYHPGWRNSAPIQHDAERH